MGVELKVEFAEGADPLWPRAGQLLSQRGFPVQMRMIDGQLAFPDETPPGDWRELRLGTAAGMVTLRREPGGVALVIWGNAEAPLVQARNALAWACAEAAGGHIITGAAQMSAGDFRASAELPAGLREDGP